jgi:hypothetical protein
MKWRNPAGKAILLGVKAFLAAVALAAGLLGTPAIAQYSGLVEAVTALPEGSTPITYRGSRYFFSEGTWYQQVVAGYVVVAPPAGIVVPALPPTYATVWLSGVPYYKANDVYYAAAPGGYAVVSPPASQGSLYYCASMRRYFPNVSDCAEGWSIVPTVPPQLRN